MELTHKVYAYITCGEELLVFRHIGLPEAGIQVPGGTLEPGEQPEQGVLREAVEETGLQGLAVLEFLGIDDLDLIVLGKSRLHRRYFYHLSCPLEAQSNWQHYETHPSDGSTEPILFEFFWIPILEAAATLHPYYTAKVSALFDGL